MAASTPVLSSSSLYTSADQWQPLRQCCPVAASTPMLSSDSFYTSAVRWRPLLPPAAGPDSPGPRPPECSSLVGGWGWERRGPPPEAGRWQPLRQCCPAAASTPVLSSGSLYASAVQRQPLTPVLSSGSLYASAIQRQPQRRCCPAAASTPVLSSGSLNAGAVQWQPLRQCCPVNSKYIQETNARFAFIY